MFTNKRVLVKGGGDLASAVIHKLFRVGFDVMVTELEQPMMVRRTVSFANCIYENTWKVEGVEAVLAKDYDQVENIIKQRKIPVCIDPKCESKKMFKPHILIDATLAKKNKGTHIDDAPIVIALGPGFCVGEDVDAIIETKRGHHLGRVLLEGKAAKNTKIPGNIGGYTVERVLRSPCEGKVENHVEIGTMVQAGQRMGKVGEQEVCASIDGIVRGLIKNGLWVQKGEKIGDIDPRGEKEYCFYISDKGRNIAGGALEAIGILLRKEQGYID